MKLLMILMLLFLTLAAWGRINVVGKIHINKRILSLNILDIQFEKENILIEDDIEIMYQFSKKIPSDIIKKYNNKNSFLVNIIIKKENNIVSQGQLITNFGSKAMLETKNENGLFKMEITARQTIAAKL